MISPFSPAGTVSSGPTRRSTLASTTRSFESTPGRPAQPGLVWAAGQTENV